MSSAPATGRPVGAARAHTPTVLQMQVTECGAACLGMVLAHYGRWVSLDELRERCGASRDGTTGSDMLAAAAYYGLEGKGYYRARRLLAELGTPLVLLWQGAHYLVLDGIDEHHVWLNDPASGPRRLTVEAFDRDYSKICLVLRPGDSFAPGGTKPSRNAGLLRRARSVLTEVLAVVVVGLLLTLPGLAVAGISRLFVDEVLVGGDRAQAWPLVLALALTAVVQTAVMFLQQRILLRVGTRLIVAETARFVEHALRLPERYFVARSVADLGQRVQQNSEVVVVLTGRLATALVGLVVVAVYAVAMFFVDPLLATIAIALTLVNLVALREGLRRQRDGSRLLVQEQSALWQTTAYGALTMESIKAGGLEGDYYARWEGTAVRVAETRQRMAILGQLAGAVPAVLRSLAGAVVLVVGAWRVIDGAMTLGSLIAFQALLGFFAAPIGELVGFASLFQHARNIVVRLDDVLDEPADPATRELTGPAATPGRLRGAFELRSVTFGFKPTRAPLISEFDLRVEPGQRVAVVGASGSGKSTLVRCPRRPLPTVGRRRAARRPAGPGSTSLGRSSPPPSAWSSSAWPSSPAPSATTSPCGTPMSPRPTWCAPRSDAQIHDEIVARAGGYAAWVTDGGANWSGGQRQRFEIARALVRNPSVLLLDEATSALDAETEAAVENALRRRGCTTLVVAHRLSTVRDADLILVLDAGTVVERGTHDELLARKGPYVVSGRGMTVGWRLLRLELTLFLAGAGGRHLPVLTVSAPAMIAPGPAPGDHRWVERPGLDAEIVDDATAAEVAAVEVAAAVLGTVEALTDLIRPAAVPPGERVIRARNVADLRRREPGIRGRRGDVVGAGRRGLGEPRRASPPAGGNCYRPLGPALGELHGGRGPAAGDRGRPDHSRRADLALRGGRRPGPQRRERGRRRRRRSGRRRPHPRPGDPGPGRAAPGGRARHRARAPASGRLPPRPVPRSWRGPAGCRCGARTGACTAVRASPPYRAVARPPVCTPGGSGSGGPGGATPTPVSSVAPRPAGGVHPRRRLVGRGGRRRRPKPGRCRDGRRLRRRRVRVRGPADG